MLARRQGKNVRTMRMIYNSQTAVHTMSSNVLMQLLDVMMTGEEYLQVVMDRRISKEKGNFKFSDNDNSALKVPNYINLFIFIFNY